MTWLYRGLIFLPNEATYFFEVFGWYFIWSQAQSCIFRAGSPLQATHQACLLTRLVCLSGLRVYLLSFNTLAPSGVCLLSTRQIIWQGKGSEKYIDLWKASYGAAPTIMLNNRNTTHYNAKTEFSLLIECRPRSSSSRQSLMEVWYLWILSKGRIKAKDLFVYCCTWTASCIYHYKFRN